MENIFYFSLPYLLSYFLQTLYGMADLFIIGQFEGAAGTTAVSIGSQVMHMITVIIVGLSMGTTVSIAAGTNAVEATATLTSSSGIGMGPGGAGGMQGEGGAPGEGGPGGGPGGMPGQGTETTTGGA